jgi:hypothetical protein
LSCELRPRPRRSPGAGDAAPNRDRSRCAARWGRRPACAAASCHGSGV